MLQDARAMTPGKARQDALTGGVHIQRVGRVCQHLLAEVTVIAYY